MQKKCGQKIKNAKMFRFRIGSCPLLQNTDSYANGTVSPSSYNCLSFDAGVMILAALITFPVMVGRKLDETVIETTWSIGWAYMLDWAALVINVVAIVLLSIDRNPDEMSLREKMADQ